MPALHRLRLRHLQALELVLGGYGKGTGEFGVEGGDPVWGVNGGVLGGGEKWRSSGGKGGGAGEKGKGKGKGGGEGGDAKGGGIAKGRGDVLFVI